MVNPATESGKGWFFLQNGYMYVGWYQDPKDGCWFYLDERDSNNDGTVDGTANCGRTTTINGKQYTFNENCRCISGTGCSETCNH